MEDRMARPETHDATLPGTSRLIERVTARRAAIVEAAMGALLAMPVSEAPDSRAVEELRQSCLQHFDAFLLTARGDRPPAAGDLPFVVDAARFCARNGLDARPTLQGYRVGPRAKSDQIVQIAAAASELPEVALGLVRVLMEFTLAASGVWMGAYLAETQPVERDAEAAGLVDDLLSSRPTALVHQRARRAGLDMAAANQVAQVAAADLAAAATATRRQLLGSRSRSLVALRDDRLVVVASAEASLGAALWRAGERTSIRAGVSLPFTGVDGFRPAHDEAGEALQLATSGQVVRLQDLRLFDYLSSRPTATARRLVPARLQQLDGAHRDTLRAFANSELNAEAAARRLGIHPNTVRNRLRRIEDVTGYDVRSIADLMDLLAGLGVLDRP